jgi:hypothetical protein
MAAMHQLTQSGSLATCMAALRDQHLCLESGRLGISGLNIIAC